MRGFDSNIAPKSIALFWCAMGFAGFANAGIAFDVNQATQQVKTQMCRDNLTVDQTLDKSIKSHSQRDLGWRAFQEEDHYDIERAVLINKAMELRYRWRVHADGSILPEGTRAENLCSADAD